MNEQEWIAGYQSPPMMFETDDTVEEGPMTEPKTAAEAVAADDERLAENERFRIWEDGYLAGLHAVNGEHRKNPYKWHGVGFVPEDANLWDIRVRVFIGTQEIKVAQVGAITRDRRGTQISQVLIHPESGKR